MSKRLWAVNILCALDEWLHRHLPRGLEDTKLRTLFCLWVHWTYGDLTGHDEK